jgi:SAM-dependent methyltransferase
MSTAAPARQAPGLDAAAIHALEQACGTAAAIDVAARAGILDRLAASPATAREVARDCACGGRTTGALLTALAALGVLVERPDGRFATASPDVPVIGRIAALWRGLEQRLRTDAPVVAADTVDGAATLYPDVVPALARMVAADAAAAAVLLRARGAVRDVLDVGAGAAPWSAALAREEPAARVTALDVPSVLAATRRGAESAGVADRFAYLAGDVFDTPLPPSAFDVVVLGNVCHLFDERANAALFGRAAAALRPGGRLAVVDVLPAPGTPDDTLVSLYALGLLLRTGSGRVYPETAYAGWAAAAGLRPVATQALPGTNRLSLLTFER